MNGGLFDRAMIFKICRNVDKLRLNQHVALFHLTAEKHLNILNKKNRYRYSFLRFLNCSCSALATTLHIRNICM